MNMDDSKPPRIFAVDYCNAAPLIWQWQKDRLLTGLMRLAPPNQCEDALLAGDAQLALVPIATLAKGPSLQIYGGYGVGSFGPVRSVCLFHKGKWHDGMRVALDPTSRTSQVLTRLILQIRMGLQAVEYVEQSVDPRRWPADVDAALRIGDEALVLQETGVADSIDLAAEWFAWQGKPFVFAVWSGGLAVDRAQVAALNRIAANGLQQLEAIAADWQKRLPLSTAAIHKYLRDHLSYPLTPSHLASIHRYLELAADRGILPPRTQPDWIAQ